RGAGLADPILHGTATLALAVSRLVARDLDGAPERVREIRARFTGMVPLPSSLPWGGGLRGGAAGPATPPATPRPIRRGLPKDPPPRRPRRGGLGLRRGRGSTARRP